MSNDLFTIYSTTLPSSKCINPVKLSEKWDMRKSSSCKPLEVQQAGKDEKSVIIFGEPGRVSAGGRSLGQSFWLTIEIMASWTIFVV